MGLPEYGSQLFETRKVYFNGTTALRQGQPLFYNNDAATGIQVPDATQADGTLYPKNVRIGNSVAALSTGATPTGINLSAFAGIVEDSSVGITGPAWVDILVPRRGDVMQIEVENFAAITKNVTLLVPQTGNSDKDAFEAKTTPVRADPIVFLALQTVAVNAGTPGTSDTRSVIWGLCV